MTDWKYTIPITRTEETDEGIFLEGEASGPGMDGHGTEMSPEAITDFADQIETRLAEGNPIPYVDQHLKKGVARELGHLVKGFVKSNGALWVRVQLDKINPIAKMIHEKIKFEGKQYGMSIAGDGLEWNMVPNDDNPKKKHPLFSKVQLREISHTPAPSWVPSLGTVLARSLDGEQGETMSDTPTTPAADAQTTEGEAEQTVAVENDDSAQESTEEAATSVTNPDATDVERARIAKADKQAIVNQYHALRTTLEAVGIDLDNIPEAVTDEDATENTDVENSENGDAPAAIEREELIALITTQVEEATAPLQKTVDAQADYIAKLEKLPAGKVPAKQVVRDEPAPADEKVDPLKDMDATQRMAYALDQMYVKKDA